jgi:hypothetical protein
MTKIFTLVAYAVPVVGFFQTAVDNAYFVAGKAIMKVQ